MSYKSEDIYISPNGEEYRIHYDESQRAYHTEVKKDGEWKPNNSSWYPHFQDACAEFDAVCRIHKLVKQGEKTCDTDQPEHAGSESATAAEVPAASPADVESAMSTLPDAEPASLAPAFDYSGLDAQTVVTLHSAEKIYRNGKRLAESGVRQMADAVGMAHDELCGSPLSHNGTTGKFEEKENTFRAWCASLGMSKTQAYRMVQISNMFEQSTPNEEKVLEELPTTLLYAAAKPSAPPELVQQVKSGDITTNKQYQEALAARKAAEADRDAAQARADKAEKALARAESEAELDRKEQEDANAAAQRFKAEAERRAQDQIRLEGLLHTREDEIARLTAENRELQKRPVTEVLPPDPEEVDRMVKEQVGLVWEQNKALKEIIEDREPSPDEKAAMFGQLQRFCHSIIDQWNLIKANLTVLPKELRDQFREGFIKNLRIIEKEVDEY